MVQAVIQTTVTGLQGSPVSPTPPNAPNQALVWSGSSWGPASPFMLISGATPLTGPLTLSGNVSGALQAVPLQQVNQIVAQYLPLTGGSISGNLSVAGVLTGQNGINLRGGDYSLNLYDTNTTNFNWGFVSANGYLTFSNTNTFAAMRCDQYGNLVITGALTQGSDQTNKTNITALSQGISLIRQLIPKSFAWTTDPTVTHWGFIAQDVEPVIPDAVSQGPAPPAGGNGLLGLDPTAILAAVTLAVKQLDSRVTVIEAHDGITPPSQEVA